ncbi:Cell adhesion molecule 2 [Holothuria leucospilota]|uniref:Cell adhesion molecule 2 n=1 Tax=Holothuria leucospilota TaxID=206669 RepID=A0A9Q1H6J0_HOLLE|nr:Cell adhesion molecule 2 [Holothuria leucospilota]
MKHYQSLLSDTWTFLTYLVLICVHTEQHLLVKWERSEEGGDVVIAAYRFSQRTTQYSGDDDRYTLTFDQNKDTSIATLVISNVALDDIGDYKCELFGVSTSSATVRLEVLVPPEEVAIIDSRTNTEIFDGGILRVTSGQPTLITCLTHFSGTRPATELVWRSQDNMVETSSMSSVVESPAEPRLEQTTSKMNFTVDVTAHGKWVECQANHDGLQQPLRTRLTLDVDGMVYIYIVVEQISILESKF